MDEARDIDEIRMDIERTRARLRDTSEALGHKADLPARTISLVGDAAELAGEWLRGRVPPARPRGDGAAMAQHRDDGPGLVEKATGAVAEGASTAAHAVAEGAQATASGVARAAEAAVEGVTSTASKATGLVGGAASSAADHAPTADDARAHPMLVGALALAAGVAAGLAIPPTRAEERAAHPLADEAKEAADRLAARATEAVGAV